MLATRARTYFEHRAAVWKGDDGLIFIDGQGRTVLRHLGDGSERILLERPLDAHGWLIDPTLSFATTGTPTFSPYDADTRELDERASLGGCQPYFTTDGRLGVWVAGAGGPIRALDLESRSFRTILRKGDERLPADRRYLYFPMPSADGWALAWAASADEHDHTRADYDVFVAATDPQTLELIGPPLRLSHHPATDRFPSIWLAPGERPEQAARAARAAEAREAELEEQRRSESGARPAPWPTSPRDAVFLWQTAGHANRVFLDDGQARTTLLEPKGRAFVDRQGRMVLRGGAFQADVETMERLHDGVRASNELSLELTFIADAPADVAPAPAEEPGVLFAFAAGARRNLVLSQRGDRLELSLRTPSTGPRADRPTVDLGPLKSGEAQHLLVSYTPGRLLAFLDGQPTAQTNALLGGFFHWQPTWLRLGAEGPRGGDADVFPRAWRGKLEGVAVYDRALDAEEAAENARRHAELRRRRPEVESFTAKVRRLRRSPTPSLREIAPYREALAVYEYEVVSRAPAAGGGVDDVPSELVPGKTVRVVHRVLLDGQEMPIAGPLDGPLELRLEPFDAQTQLESLYLSDQLGGEGEGDGIRLYWSDRLEP